MTSIIISHHPNCPSYEDGIALKFLESQGSLAATPPDLYPIRTGEFLHIGPLGGGSVKSLCLLAFDSAQDLRPDRPSTTDSI